MYNFKIKWCPVCNQGWVQIVKEKDSGRLFLYCEECETEWDNPKNILKECGTQEVYGSIEEPMLDEVKKIGWVAFLLES